MDGKVREIEEENLHSEVSVAVSSEIGVTPWSTRPTGTGASYCACFFVVCDLVSKSFHIGAFPRIGL